MAVSACSYSVQGAAPHTAAQLVAGQQLLLVVETRDQYYNLSPVEASRLKAHASGSQGSVPFSSLPAPPRGPPQQQQQLAATLLAAGSYSLTVVVVDPATQVSRHLFNRTVPVHRGEEKRGLEHMSQVAAMHSATAKGNLIM